MPIRFMEVADGAGGVILGEGVVTGADFIAIGQQFLAMEDRLSQWMFVVTDLSGAKSVEATTDDLRRVAGVNRAMSEKTRRGFMNPIVASDDLTFGLARMWQVFVQEAGWKTTVVRTRADAESWVRAEVAKSFGVTLPTGPLDH